MAEAFDPLVGALQEFHILRRLLPPYSQDASFTGGIISHLYPYATPTRQKSFSFRFTIVRVFFPTRQLKDSLHWIACSKFGAAGSPTALKV